MTDIATASLQTPRDLIRWGGELFEHAGLAFGHGTDNALDESAALVMHALGIGYDQPDTVLDGEVSKTDRQRVVELLERRVSSRKPAAYLVNEINFAGLPFYVDERVLVPRSPIAELVETGFAPWIDPQRVGHVLDLCTGSGCIGIACAYAFADARVDVTDLSADALAVARENIRRHELKGRVTAVQSDLFGSLAGRRYDLIVSNPPYVPLQEFEALPAEYHNEPELGLVAGNDGLDIVIRILAEAAEHLETWGILVVELGHTYRQLAHMFPNIPFVWLDFEYGGEGVFLLEAASLREHLQVFRDALAGRDPAAVAGDDVEK